MDRKTRRRVGALRRLLAERDRLAKRPRYSWYLQRNEPEKRADIEQEINILRKRIPSDVLAREGLS